MELLGTTNEDKTTNYRETRAVQQETESKKSISINDVIEAIKKIRTGAVLIYGSESWVLTDAPKTENKCMQNESVEKYRGGDK